MANAVRVVVARLGMDAHWRGSVVVARALRDAGMEVVYLGNQTPEAIADAAVQEAVDVVGLSTLSGNHLELVPRVVERLRDRGAGEVPVVVGGTIPRSHVPLLTARGVARVFGPGSSLDEIVRYVDRLGRAPQGRPSSTEASPAGAVTGSRHERPSHT